MNQQRASAAVRSDSSDSKQFAFSDTARFPFPKSCQQDPFLVQEKIAERLARPIWIPAIADEDRCCPSRFVGTFYYAANWKFVGKTKGYQSIRSGYSNTLQASNLFSSSPPSSTTPAWHSPPPHFLNSM